MRDGLRFAFIFGMGWRQVTDIQTYNLSMKLKQEFDAILDRHPTCRDRRFCDDARDATGSAVRNIAEGFGRYGTREFARFVEIAYASQLETQTNVQIATNRRYMSQTEFDDLWPLSEEAKATTLGLLKSLKRRLSENKMPKRPSTSQPQ